MWERLRKWVDWASFAHSLFEWTGLGKPAVSALLAIVGVILGLIDGVPKTYLLLVAVGIFALAMLALNQIDAWRERNSVSHKLIFDSAVVHCTVSRSGIAAGQKIANYQPAAVFRNTSERGIWYTVKRMHSVINGQSDERPKSDTKSGFIPAGETLEYRYTTIPSVDYSAPPVTGILEYEVQYGASPKKMIGTLEQKWSMEIYWRGEETGPPTWVKVQELPMRE
jgi:hypothetical protein